MCKRCGESVDHLLLHCPIAYDVEYDLLLVWYLLGDAAKGSGFVGLLVMQFQATL